MNIEKQHATNFSKQQKRLCLSLHYNGANKYSFVNGVEIYLSLHYNGANKYWFVNGVKIYKFKANDSEVNAAPLCLSNISKYFSADNITNIRLYG